MRIEALKRPISISASRRAVLRPWLIGRTEAVSGAADGVDQGALELPVDLAPQPPDMHIDDIGARIEMIIPHALEQHGARDDAAGVAHQIFEEAELARLERDLPSAAAHDAREEIHLEIGDPEHGLTRRG